jgi:hypothetical protein
MFLSPDERRILTMKAKYIAEITQIINKLEDHQLLYILTFIKKLFGSRH